MWRWPHAFFPWNCPVLLLPLLPLLAGSQARADPWDPHTARRWKLQDRRKSFTRFTVFISDPVNYIWTCASPVMLQRSCAQISLMQISAYRTEADNQIKHWNLRQWTRGRDMMRVETWDTHMDITELAAYLDMWYFKGIRHASCQLMIIYCRDNRVNIQ